MRDLDGSMRRADERACKLADREANELAQISGLALRRLKERPHAADVLDAVAPLDDARPTCPTCGGSKIRPGAIHEMCRECNTARPGDTVIIVIPPKTTVEQADAMRKAALNHLAGIDVVVIAANQVVIYRPNDRMEVEA